MAFIASRSGQLSLPEYPQKQKLKHHLSRMRLREFLVQDGLDKIAQEVMLGNAESP